MAMKDFGTAQAVLDAIDDAEIIRSRNPVMFARLSRAGENALTLQQHYEAWFAGATVLPSSSAGFVPSSKTLGQRKRNRKKNKTARSARRANR